MDLLTKWVETLIKDTLQPLKESQHKEDLELKQVYQEETHKVDGQEVNFPLQCNNNKLPKYKLRMEIMDKEPPWYKRPKVKEEHKLDKHLAYPVINNSMLESPSLKLLLLMLETDFENYITDT